MNTLLDQVRNKLNLCHVAVKVLCIFISLFSLKLIEAKHLELNFLALLPLAWLFYAFLEMQLGFGYFIIKKRDLWSHPSLALGLGFLVTSFYALILFQFEIISPEYKVLLTYSFIVLGVMLCPKKKIMFDKKSNLEFSAIWMILGLLILISAILIILPHPFWDSLWYHLSAPRSWALANKMGFTPHALINVQASYWEFIYLFIQVMFLPFEKHGDLLAHIFSQWLHFIGGAGGTLLVVKLFFEKTYHNKMIKQLFPVFCIMVLTHFSLHYSYLSAKNDWGLALWFFLGLLVLDKNELLGGLFLGVVAGAKFTYLLPLILILFFFRKSKAALIMALPLGFILLRNYSWTQNPFFPGLNQFFGGPWLGPTWEEGLQCITGNGLDLSSENINRKLYLLFGQFRWFSFFYFLWPFFNRRNQKLNYLWITVLISFLYVILFMGKEAEFRLLTGILILFYLFCVLTINEILIRIKSPRYQAVLKSSIIWTMIFICLVNPRLFSIPTLDIKGPVNLFSLYRGQISKFLKSHYGLTHLDWIKKNVHHQQKIFLLSDVKNYYYLDYKIVRIWDDPILDKKIRSRVNIKGVIDELIQEGGVYLMDSTDSIDKYFHRPTVYSLVKVVRSFPMCIERSDKKGWIARLLCLKEHLN